MIGIQLAREGSLPSGGKLKPKLFGGESGTLSVQGGA